MEDLLTVTLLCLATFRVTYFLVSDQLIQEPRAKMTNWLETRKENKTGKVTHVEWQSKLAYLVTCPWCMSVWIGAAFTLVTHVFYDVPVPVLTWLTSSAVTGMLATLVEDE